MTKKVKERLGKLSTALKEPKKKEQAASKGKSTKKDPFSVIDILGYDPNPDRKERGEFIKQMVTIPPQMQDDLKMLGITLKMDISELVRAAVAEFLIKHKK